MNHLASITSHSGSLDHFLRSGPPGYFSVASAYSDKSVFLDDFSREPLRTQQTSMPKRGCKQTRISWLKAMNNKNITNSEEPYKSQFKKIHENSSIAEEDKIQYLLQSAEPHSEAEFDLI
ncbi:hypothetical protein TNCV_2193721 [Trichonephila clavipes]|uniref:Uncharacterized protein n=1 Tax=Trichonephila clavipes TaxID=2585209 RepID=A0A8X6SLI6_TRICX|nr:hypothetical protein TNCV_2193721 [Trichonephila clavipes]